MARSFFILSVLFIGLMMPLSSAKAMGFVDYNEEIFKQAQDANKTIVLHVGTTWCTVCQYQKHVLQKEAVQKDLMDVIMMTIDFDTQRNIAESYGAFQRSTIIIYKGKKQQNILINEKSRQVILDEVKKVSSS